MLYGDVKNIIKNCEPEDIQVVRDGIIVINRKTDGKEYSITLTPDVIQEYVAVNILRINLKLNLEQKIIETPFPTNKSFSDLVNIANEKVADNNIAYKFMKEFGIRD